MKLLKLKNKKGEKMKKLAISTLAVLIACPAFAGINHPDQGSSWTMWGMDPYIAMRGGMSYSNLNYKYEGNKESMTDYIFQGRAALGLEVCDTVRSEVEWTYFGKNSTTSRYIGWTYVVEWYNADGVVIAFNSVRINLSNETCHSSIEPYYLSDVIKTANEYTDKQIDEKIAEVTGAITVVEF
jgi:hypothetical protein